MNRLSRDNLVSLPEWERFSGVLREFEKDYTEYFLAEADMTPERFQYLRGYITAIREMLELPDRIFNEKGGVKN